MSSVYISHRAILVAFCWFYFCFPSLLDCWSTPCPSNGIKVCSSSDLPETISTPTVLSNCVYDGCPQLIVYGTSLTLNSVTFKNSVPADSGSSISTIGTNHAITITNCKFINCSATNQGGAIYATSSTNPIVISQSSFVGCTSVNQGGAISLSGSVGISVSNTDFIHTYSQNGGGIYASSGNSTIIGGRCVSSNAASLGGCFYLTGMGNYVSGVYVDGAWDVTEVWGTGGFITINSSPFYVFVKDCLIIGTFNPIYLYGSSRDSMNLENVTMVGCFNRPIYAQTSMLTGNNVRIIDTNTHDPVDANTLVLTNSYLNCPYRGYNVTFINVTMENWNANPTPYNNYLYFDTVTFRNCIVHSVGIIGMVDFGIPDIAPYMMLKNVWIENVTIPEDGGVIGIFYVLPTITSLNIGSNVTIRNNVIQGYGGAVYIRNANLTFLNSARDVQFYNNVATQNLDRDFLALLTESNTFILGNLRGEGNRIEGGVYIASNETAATILGSPTLLNILPPTSYYTGPASYLTFSEPSELQNDQVESLYLSQGIPTIQVKVNDYFGGAAPMDLAKFVIVSCKETQRNATLTGETIKGVFSDEGNPVNFYLGIRDVNPGNFSLTFSAINLNPILVRGSELRANLTFLQCDPFTQKYVPTAKSCYTRSNLDVNTVYSIGGLAIFALAELGALLIYSYRVKDLAILETKGKWYVIVLITGSTLCAIGFLSHLNRGFGGGCMLSEWFVNLGFINIIFAALYRSLQLSKLHVENSKIVSSAPVSTGGGNSTGSPSRTSQNSKRPITSSSSEERKNSTNTNQGVNQPTNESQ